MNMFNPVTGQFIEVNRGQEMVIPDIQKARIRQVHLPDIPQTVLCVPTPLMLETGDVTISSKTEGHYTGIMTIVFTPQF